MNRIQLISGTIAIAISISFIGCAHPKKTIHKPKPITASCADPSYQMQTTVERSITFDQANKWISDYDQTDKESFYLRITCDSLNKILTQNGLGVDGIFIKRGTRYVGVTEVFLAWPSYD